MIFLPKDPTFFTFFLEKKRNKLFSCSTEIILLRDFLGRMLGGKLEIEKNNILNLQEKFAPESIKVMKSRNN